MGILVLDLLRSGIIIKVSILFTYCKTRTWVHVLLPYQQWLLLWSECEHTHITSDLPALLAREKWDIFMVQLVACSLRLIPLLFVEFLKSHKAGKCLYNIWYAINKHTKLIKKVMNWLNILHYLTDVLRHLPAVGQLRSVIWSNVMTLFCIEGLFVLQLW